MDPVFFAKNVELVRDNRNLQLDLIYILFLSWEFYAILTGRNTNEETMHLLL